MAVGDEVKPKDVTPSPKPTLGDPDGSGDSGSSTGSTQTQTPPKSSLVPTLYLEDGATKDYPIKWVVNGKTYYVSKEWAGSALVPGTPQYKAIYAAWKSYGKVLTNKSTFPAFWKKVLTDISGTATDPFSYVNVDLKQNAIDFSVEAGKPKTSQSKYFTLTTKATAYSDIENAFETTFGFKPSEQEKARYYKALNAAEKASATTTTYTTINGVTNQTTTQNKVDFENLKKDYLYSALKSTLKKNPTKKLLGIAGQYQNDLLTYANEGMGLMKGTGEINNYVLQAMSGKNINDIYKNIKKDAVAMYGNYANRLNEDNPGDVSKGLTIRDLANNYIQLMGQTLELDPTNIKLTDKTIHSLITSDKLPNMNEARKIFRQDNRWTNTTGAIEESKKVGYSILRAFGYGV
jgi:hypothetical protein